MKNYNNKDFINTETGEDTVTKNLALLIKEIVGYTGKLKHDITKLDGTPRKLMDVSKLKFLGWKASRSLPERIKIVQQEVENYKWN